MSLSENMLQHRNLFDLKAAITYLSVNCNSKSYPTKYQTYDEAWEELFINYDLLRKKLGDTRYEQVVDMTKQAKAHYDADETHLGSWLMQDIGEVICRRPPFAYPEDKYRWPRPG